MRLLDLTLKNIGPFDDAHLEFHPDEANSSPVAIVTGENGTGKTIILDAIRGLFGAHYTPLERAIWRPDGTPFFVSMTLMTEKGRQDLSSQDKSFPEPALIPNNQDIFSIPINVAVGKIACPRWIVDYWRSALPIDSYTINSLTRQPQERFLMRSLQGIQRNAAVTELITSFDYLRGSDDPNEKQDGEALYEIMRKIVSLSVLNGGELSHVDRRNFMPMIRQSGQLVPLSNLSSGNAYLIQHLIGLLGKMYAVHSLCKTDVSEICSTPGLLLIDEAENHLHPRWQKRFLRDVRNLFPNLQIIATTHSPFIVSSVPGARVFVCAYDKEKDCCVVNDESSEYSNKPMEEILLSPAFSETQPFGVEITRLLEARKAAILIGNEEERTRIEAALKEKNPTYFSYLDIEKQIQALRGHP